MGVYRVMIIVSFAFSAISTVFFVVGPKILGNATSELASGLSAKISGNGGMDFDTIGRILITVLIIYSIGAVSYTHLDVYKRQTYRYCSSVPE